MQKIIVGLCAYTIIASGIALAQGPVRQCYGGGNWFIDKCRGPNFQSLAACNACCRNFPGEGCVNPDSEVGVCIDGCTALWT